jgi:hypothetical protein
MTGRIASHAKLTHGYPLPDHLNPAKQPGGRLRNDHEAGPSGTARPGPGSAPPRVPEHRPGQEVAASPRTPSRARPHRDGDLSSELGAPAFTFELPPTPPDSPLPAWMERRGQVGSGLPESRGSASPTLSELSMANHAGLTLDEQLERAGASSHEGSPQASRQDSQEDTPPPQGAGAQGDRASASSGENPLGEILGLMGGGRFRNWNDIHAGLHPNEDFDARLDKVPFIATHLDPDKESPDREKSNWTRLPDASHPLFADFVTTRNPQFYSFRRPKRRSAPEEERQAQAAADAAPDRTGARLGRSQSLPADFRFPAGPVHPLALMVLEGHPGTGAGATVTGAAGAGANGSAHRDERVPTDAQGDRPHAAGGQATADPADPRLEDLIEENARLRKKVKDITTKAIIGGVAAVGVGLAAGMLIESKTGEQPPGPTGDG